MINNAGYDGANQLFTEKDPLDREQMMKVLMTVPLRLIYAALPEMSKNGRGTIINVSSASAFLPGKRMAIYAASKAFTKSFSESLYLEVKNKGIKVQVVCPGWTDTNIFRDVSAEVKAMIFKKFKVMSPETVVDCSLKDLSKNHVVSIPGTYNKVTTTVSAIIPRSFLYRRIDKAMP